MRSLANTLNLNVVYAVGIHEAFQYVAESLVNGFLSKTSDSLLESDAFALRVNARMLESRTNSNDSDDERPTGWCAC